MKYASAPTLDVLGVALCCLLTNRDGGGGSMFAVNEGNGLFWLVGIGLCVGGGSLIVLATLLCLCLCCYHTPSQVPPAKSVSVISYIRKRHQLQPPIKMSASHNASYSIIMSKLQKFDVLFKSMHKRVVHLIFDTA